MSYTDADLVILCFAIDSPDSMENVVSKVRLVSRISAIVGRWEGVLLK